MSAASADKYFWLSYCQGIQEAVGAQPGGSSAVFFTTKAQKGPLASPLIPADYTNYGIYNIADNLLAANNLFYVPSTQNSYIRSLQNYLGYVDLGGSGNEAVITRVVTTKQALNAAIENAKRELLSAYKDFQQQQGFGMTGNQTFQQWWPQNAPAYANAVKQQNAAAAANQSAVNDMDGPLAAQYQLDTQKITQALTSTSVVPGISMAASAATPASAQEVLNAVNEGKNVPEPKDVYYVPAYASPQYVNTVKDWINDPSRGRVGNQKIVVQISEGKNVDESSFGQTSAGGGLSFSYVPWISFGANASVTKETQLNNGDYTDNDVSITLTYDQIQAVPVNPGNWNIGNPKASYPKLKPGAPITAQVLVEPTQLILIKNLGYTIKFSDSLKTSFDKQVKSTESGGGYVRVFGIPIQVGGSFTKTNEDTTHVATWDSDSGEFVVAPTDEGAFASIVAIQGDKINTT